MRNFIVVGLIALSSILEVEALRTQNKLQHAFSHNKHHQPDSQVAAPAEGETAEPQKQSQIRSKRKNIPQQPAKEEQKEEDQNVDSDEDDLEEEQEVDPADTPQNPNPAP